MDLFCSYLDLFCSYLCNFDFYVTVDVFCRLSGVRVPTVGTYTHLVPEVGWLILPNTLGSRVLTVIGRRAPKNLFFDPPNNFNVLTFLGHIRLVLNRRLS